MNRCEQVQAQLLEHVYGLLEGEPAGELGRHLEECAACQAAWQKVQEQRALLAAASKLDYATVHFEAPAAVPFAEVSDARQRTGGGSSTWFRWAVAATILVVIGGLGFPHALSSNKQERVAQTEARVEQLKKDEQRLNEEYRARSDKFRRDRDNLAKEIQAIEQEINKLDAERNREINKVVEENNKRSLRMTITGPKTPEPGAPNNYEIETKSINHQPV